MTVYRFDPEEMRGLAADLRRAADAAGAASLALIAVPTDGLPPEAAGLVAAQTRALWRLLAQGQSSLTGGARYLTGMATAVRKADDPTLRAAGLNLLTVTKAGEIVLKEISDRATGHRTALPDRARRWARILGTVSGEKAVLSAVGWSEWRKALRDAGVTPGSPLRRQIYETIRARAQSNIDEIQRYRGNSAPPDGGKGKQWGRRVSGLAPGPAGDLADLAAYLHASRKLRADEPQTGVAQVATDIRDFADLVAASNHLAADALIKTPLTAPAAVINEGIGLGADAVVLTLDSVNEARKGVDRVIDSVGDGFKSLARLP
ncbi:hypothetical protein [Phytohabitans houttuyneae]|uniref:Uncharacterized protein n=1 Tax=Phytohabitans houttuyneae TaxID=1076126 RepID=A0A6V8K7A1_9ACTN|nr:hypothetical protein [Phytohabitans houttuyneae]GFJ81083.1 hypothetical protein Phou_052630 [Phytohabitans houttuyneae]